MRPRGEGHLGERSSSREGLPEDPVARIGYVRNPQQHGAEMLTITLRWNTFRGKHVTEQLEPCLCLSLAQPGDCFLLPWKINELMKMDYSYSKGASTGLLNLTAMWRSKSSFVLHVALKLSCSIPSLILLLFNSRL
jgi:hypothetical protein